MVRKTNELTIEEIDASIDTLLDVQFMIIDYMEERKLSKKDLADRLGVTPARISQLLSPCANPSIRQIGRIFYALGVNRPFKCLVPREIEIEQMVKARSWTFPPDNNIHVFERKKKRYKHELHDTTRERVAA